MITPGPCLHVADKQRDYRADKSCQSFYRNVQTAKFKNELLAIGVAVSDDSLLPIGFMRICVNFAFYSPLLLHLERLESENSDPIDIIRPQTWSSSMGTELVKAANRFTRTFKQPSTEEVLELRADVSVDSLVDIWFMRIWSFIVHFCLNLSYIKN